MKNLMIIAILALLAIGSFFFLRGLQDELAPKVVEEKIQPIAVGYKVETRVYNEKNQLAYQVVSDKIIEYSKKHGTEFHQPLVWSWDSQQQLNWKGQSSEAFLTGNHELLTMKKNVEIVESPDSDKPIYLNGEEIFYNAKTSMLESQLPTKVDDGTSWQTSNKMQVNTKTEQVVVTGSVKARFQTATVGNKTN